jgi:hypothetical protein
MFRLRGNSNYARRELRKQAEFGTRYGTDAQQAAEAPTFPPPTGNWGTVTHYAIFFDEETRAWRRYGMTFVTETLILLGLWVSALAALWYASGIAYAFAGAWAVVVLGLTLAHGPRVVRSWLRRLRG